MSHLEPKHIIDETVTIEGADIEKVYDDCVTWLSGLGAEKLEEDYPSFIKASHKGDRPYYEDFGKLITISLTHDNGNVVIRVVMDEREKTLFFGGIENRRRSWLKIVELLWKHIGVVLDDETLCDLYPETSLEKIISDHKKRWWEMLFLMGLLIIFVLAYPPIASAASIPALLIIIVLVGEAYTVKKYQKRLRELYPDR